MIEHNYLAWYEERRKDLQKEAEREQLIRAIKSDDGHTIRKAIGRGLTATGRFLAEQGNKR